MNRPHIDDEYPIGDPESLTCRHCGRYRRLKGRNLRPGMRVLECRVCDSPAPTVDNPLVSLGES